MIRFLTWLRSILMAVVNGLAKAVVLVLLIFAVLLLVSLARGDGLPGNMVLALDLREPIDDSAASPGTVFPPRRVTVMDLVLGLDAAGRDKRVKGVVMRLGNGALSTAEAQEIADAIARFRAKGKFVIAQATAFFSPGLGDYLTASAANQAKGAVKETVGKMTGDAKLKAEGAADKAAGKVQNAVGGAKDAMRDALKH